MAILGKQKKNFNTIKKDTFFNIEKSKKILGINLNVYSRFKNGLKEERSKKI